MAREYTKDFLIAVYVSRYAGYRNIEVLKANAEKFYDVVGKDAFRKYASLDADAIKQFKELNK